MALIKHVKIGSEAELGVWHFDEEESWYLHRLQLQQDELDELTPLLPKKREEWLASRWLLHEMSGREVRGKVLKDAFGKPHLENSEWTISLSHSAERAAVLASANACGVDIQRIEKRILRMAPRFMSEKELIGVDLLSDIEKIHVYWGGKEAMFKLFSEGNVDFRRNLYIDNFVFQNKGQTTAVIDIRGQRIECSINYEKLDNYILVWAIATS